MSGGKAAESYARGIFSFTEWRCLDDLLKKFPKLSKSRRRQRLLACPSSSGLGLSCFTRPLYLRFAFSISLSASGVTFS